MIMRMGERRVFPVVALVLAGSVIGACGSSSNAGAPNAQPSQSSSPSPAASATPSATTTSPSATPSPTAIALSFAAMKAALLPKSAAPPGYRLAHQGAVQPSGTLGCGRNGVTPQREVGVDFQGSGVRTGAEVTEFIRGYPSAAVAHKAIRQISAFAKTCHQVSTYRFKPVGYPSVGDSMVAISIAEASPVGGVAASGQLIFVLSGASILELVTVGSPNYKAVKSVPIIKAALARLAA
jgi:hypothetical protein